MERPIGSVSGDLVDDALDEDYADVDVAGDVGEELGDEVVDRGGGQAGDVRAAVVADSRFRSRDIEVGDFSVDREADEIGVVGHAFAVVAWRPTDLDDGS